MSKEKNITIRDVADKAGVSISTVSRALNSPSKVKKETLTRVRNAIKELNYSCNSFRLRILEDNHSKTVIIFMPNIFTEDLAEIARGAQEELEKHHVDCFIWNANENAATENRGVSLLKQWADGAIFITSCVEDLDLNAIAAKIPIAAVERTIADPNIDLINVDAEQGMDILVSHLYELGHRHIGLLCGDISSSNAIAKTMAFKKALEKKGIRWIPSRVISSGWSIQCGHLGVQQLLGLHPDTTAVICITDVLAFGAIGGIYSMGYSCPGNISVTGFDNSPSSAYFWPTLTTLDFPCYSMGQMAAQKILQRLEQPDQPTETTVLPLKLIKRQSTGPVPE